MPQKVTLLTQNLKYRTNKKLSQINVKAFFSSVYLPIYYP